MKPKLLTTAIAVLVFIPLALCAQTGAFTPQVLSELKQLQSAALRSEYGYSRVQHLCDNIGPRPAGSVQYRHAAEYVAGELRKLGLDVKLEKVTVTPWVRGEESAQL